MVGRRKMRKRIRTKKRPKCWRCGRKFREFQYHSYSDAGDFRERCPQCGTLHHADIPLFPLRLVGKLGWVTGFHNIEQEPAVEFAVVWSVGMIVYIIVMLTGLA